VSSKRRLEGLYAITPDGLGEDELARRVEAVLAGGARLVQFRDKKLGPAQRERRSRSLHGLCKRFGVPLIVNDDLELALRIGADGVHLGRDDGDVALARRALGSERILGLSCYNEIERALAAMAAGADYVAFGSVFPSLTKPSAARATTGLLRHARDRLSIPIAAIGGITAENAPEVIAAGANLLAVISDVFDAADIRGRAEQYARLFGQWNTM